MDWLPAIIIILVNIVAVAFAFGILTQKVNDLTRRVAAEENIGVVDRKDRQTWEQGQEKRQDKQNNIAQAAGERLDALHSTLLPECVEQFELANQRFSSIEGQLNVIIKLVTNGVKTIKKINKKRTVKKK